MSGSSHLKVGRFLRKDVQCRLGHLHREKVGIAGMPPRPSFLVSLPQHNPSTPPLAWPDSSARSKAASQMTPPRATLTMRMPRFTLEKASSSGMQGREQEGRWRVGQHVKMGKGLEGQKEAVRRQKGGGWLPLLDSQGEGIVLSSARCSSCVKQRLVCEFEFTQAHNCKMAPHTSQTHTHTQSIPSPLKRSLVTGVSGMCSEKKSATRSASSKVTMWIPGHSVNGANTCGLKGRGR